MTKKNIRHLIDLSKLLEKVPNRFLLTLAAAKRARQLFEGARPLVDASIADNKVLDIALLEIQEGKIIITTEDYSDEELIIDEISDYLDSDIIDTKSMDAAAPKKTDKKSKRSVSS